MIPCCFHPTRVVVIDDKDEFLTNLNLTLSKDQATYEFSTNPQKMLHYLNEDYKPNPFSERYIENVDEEDWEHRRLDVNIFDTHHEVYRPERFNEISTVVIDHSMPGMTGIQFCKQLKDQNIQKIVLTGTANEEIAIRAFNEGIINHYIRKQDIDMVDQLNQAISASQWRYFKKLSEVPYKAITTGKMGEQALSEPAFQALFRKVMETNRFREAYLCETMGSYLFLTENAQPYGLVINEPGQLDIWVDSAESLKVNPGLVQDLKERKKMMCYHNRQGILEPVAQEWEKHAHPAQLLEGGRGQYYYAFAPGIFDIDETRVVPFKKHKAGKKFEISY